MQDRARPSGGGVARSILGITRVPALATAMALVAACGASTGNPVALPVTPGTPGTDTDAFDEAIAVYRATGRQGPLVDAIAADPDDERAGVWNELLALEAYDRAWALGELHDDRPDDYDPAPQIDASMLRGVVAQYPDTFASSMARVGLDTEQLVLEREAVRFLTKPVLNPHVVAFLAGEGSWIAEVDDGSDGGVRIDLGRFRTRYAEGLKRTIATTLVDDACRTSMGYCRWYAQQFPADPTSVSVRTAIKAEWRRRAHPPWQGKAHLQCAYNCTRRCKAAPVDLNDACYEPCFAQC